MYDEGRPSSYIFTKGDMKLEFISSIIAMIIKISTYTL